MPELTDAEWLRLVADTFDDKCCGCGQKRMKAIAEKLLAAQVRENATLPGKKILRELAAQGAADEAAEATQKHEPYGEEFIRDLFDEELE